MVPGPVTAEGVQLIPAIVDGAAMVNCAVEVPPASEALIMPVGVPLETAAAVN